MKFLGFFNGSINFEIEILHDIVQNIIAQVTIH